ncbi:hypothetical protein HDU93_000925 [Gonapodya sp. JEL0774]|nr:hypothetical protein HDU93_000925 [Gonapodya sp. JEL0774]
MAALTPTLSYIGQTFESPESLFSAISPKFRDKLAANLADKLSVLLAGERWDVEEEEEDEGHDEPWRDFNDGDSA